MGLEVDDYERGDNCNLCYDPGKTPKYISVVFSGTDIDGLFVLTQDIPCTWVFGGPLPELLIMFRHGPATTKLQAEDGFKEHFFKEGALCSTEFFDAGKNAWAYTWSGVHPSVADMVGSGYLWSGPGTKYEAYYWGDNKWTFKLCNKRVPSNLLVSYQP